MNTGGYPYIALPYNVQQGFVQQGPGSASALRSNRAHQDVPVPQAQQFVPPPGFDSMPSDMQQFIYMQQRIPQGSKEEEKLVEPVKVPRKATRSAKHQFKHDDVQEEGEEEEKNKKGGFFGKLKRLGKKDGGAEDESRGGKTLKKKTIPIEQRGRVSDLPMEAGRGINGPSVVPRVDW